MPVISVMAMIPVTAVPNSYHCHHTGTTDIIAVTDIGITAVTALTGQCRIPTTDCEKDQLLKAGLGEKEIQMLHYRCNAH